MGTKPINWDSVFGLGSRVGEKKYQQINVVARETLADEASPDNTSAPPGANDIADTLDSSGDSGTPPSDENKTSDDASFDDSSSDGGDDSGGGFSDGGGVGDSGSDSGGDFGDGGGDFGSDSSSDSSSSDFSSSSSSDTPVGVNPNRIINGKLILSENIRDLITEIETTLDAFQKISFKNPVVVNLGELQKEIKLLLEIVPSARNEDIMVRYELYVRRYRELITKIRRKRS
jgi:hypothetical protein